MSEEKAAKVFVEASMNRMYNPYHFANLVKQASAISADAMGRAAVGWFMLNEIDYISNGYRNRALMIVCLALNFSKAVVGS